MNVRPATIDDMDALLGLQAEIHEMHVEAEPQRYRRAGSEVVRARFCELLAADGAEIFVVDDGDAVLGYLVATQERRDGHPLARPRTFVLVDAISVSSRARRRGVGRRLMEAAQAYAERLGVEGVELTVRAFNTEAIAFYESLGYAPAMLRMVRPTPKV